MTPPPAPGSASREPQQRGGPGGSRGPGEPSELGASRARPVEPAALAVEAAALASPTLFAFDIDGVLAPLVDRPEDSALAPGVLDALGALAQRSPVAAVSGRALDSIEQFQLPPSMHVSGSHGSERRGVTLTPLDAVETARLAELVAMAERAAAEAGEGAWLEHKPTSVVLHTRRADPSDGARAADRLARDAAGIAGAQVKPGHLVVELAARVASKAVAIAALRAEVGAEAVCYLGDDVTDEDVFRTLDPATDLAVRVGPGETAAWRRLASAADAARFVHLLTT